MFINLKSLIYIFYCCIFCGDKYEILLFINISLISLTLVTSERK